MNNFEAYHYIYKDAHGKWNTASNPSFIAEHKNCKAIEKAVAPNIEKYLYNLNKG